MDRAWLWLRNAVGTSFLLGRQAVLSLRNNWGIGLLSLALATSLWVYVTDRENPERTARVPGAVTVEAVNVPPDQAVFSISPESVSVRARAPESVLQDLTAEDFRATVDVSAVTSQTATVEVRVESAEPRAKFVDSEPATVSVRLERVTSRTVPVRTKLVGTPPRGFQTRDVSVQPQEVVVTGSERLVSRVATVEADVNLTGVRTNFQETLLLQARDERGANIEGVSVAPESAVVHVDVLQVQFSAPFIVQPMLTGAPAPGYNVTGTQIEPAIVVITGTSEVFATLDPSRGIETEEISIEGATADVVHTVALRLPQGAEVEQPDVTVRVVIAPARGELSFSVAVQPANVPAGLSATLEPATVQVVLSGLLPDLNAVDVAAISATADLSGLEAGEHTVTITVRGAPNTSVVSVTPAEVRVTLRAP